MLFFDVAQRIIANSIEINPYKRIDCLMWALARLHLLIGNDICATGWSDAEKLRRFIDSFFANFSHFLIFQTNCMELSRCIRVKMLADT